MLRGIVGEVNLVVLGRRLCGSKKGEFNYLEKWLDPCRANKQESDDIRCQANFHNEQRRRCLER